MTDPVCESCRAEPATHLSIKSVGAPGCKAPIIVKRLAGDKCASASGLSERLYALAPVLEVAHA